MIFINSQADSTENASENQPSRFSAFNPTIRVMQFVQTEQADAETAIVCWFVALERNACGTLHAGTEYRKSPQ